MAASDKGTVKTKATLALYNDDVDRAYEALEHGIDAATGGDDFSPQVVKSDESKVLAFVHALVSDALGREVGLEDDFFRNGVYSLDEAVRVDERCSSARRYPSRSPAEPCIRTPNVRCPIALPGGAHCGRAHIGKGQRYR